ncbi:hypothetical protein ACFL1H_03000 [Nanoarchaeota archaeon]
MFIRTKKIKGKEYAYKVVNVWRKRKKGSRQKVGKYLGKVIDLEPKENMDFFEFINKEPNQYLNNSQPVDIIKDLIELQLHNYGFERKRKTYLRDNYIFHMPTLKVKDVRDKNVVLRLNQGFLCERTVKDLLNFKTDFSTEREIATKLANQILETGLVIPDEVFVFLFQKVLAELKTGRKKEIFSLDKDPYAKFDTEETSYNVDDYR